MLDRARAEVTGELNRVSNCLSQLEELFEICDPHCAEGNEESFTDFLLVPVKNGDRRAIERTRKAARMS